MIPRVAGSGQSFDGAGQYYLHDKRKDQDGLSTDADRVGDYTLHDKADRQTAFRVGFTEILNMDADTPAQAIAQMSASYERYKERERNKRGRKLTKPVYAYSLAWAFDQTPDRDEMMAAALSSLKALDLENLQTLIVQHTDEPQPHVHVIVNRIELDGRNARNIFRDHLALSKWAEQYERDHGRILCERRVANNEARRRGEFVRDTVSLTPAEYAARERLRKSEKLPWATAADFLPKKPPDTRATAPTKTTTEFGDFERMSPAQFAARERLRQAENLPWATAADFLPKGPLDHRVAALANQHIRERRHLEATTEARIAADRAAAKARFAPKWTNLYKLQAIQLQILKAANKGGIFERACFVFANRDFLKKGGKLGIKEIAKFAFSSRALTGRVQRVHTLERVELASWQDRLASGAVRIVRQDHREELVKLRTRQQLETDGLNHTLRTELEAIWRAGPKGQSEVSRPLPAPEAHLETQIGVPSLDPPQPSGPQPSAPSLRPGEAMLPSDLASYLHDRTPLREDFQNAVKPAAELSKADEITKRMEEYKRRHPKRDFGRRRGR